MATVRPSFTAVDAAVDTLKKVNEYITTGMETTLDIAQDVMDNNKHASSKCVDELKTIMHECTSMERDIQNLLQSVKYMKQTVQSGDDRDLEMILDAKLTEIRQENRDGDLLKHTKYVDLMKKLDTVQHSTEGDSAGVEHTMVDEDVAMAQEVRTKCPFTGKRMTEPVRNTLCGHHYDLSGVKQMLKNRKGKAKCPVSGCVNDKPIASSDLEEDKHMKKLIEKKLREAPKRSKKH